MNANQHSDPNQPYLLVGLGNPGRAYRKNRHNVGFMLMDRLAERMNQSFSRVESQALLTKANYKGRRILLAKPQTFMNLSGQSVGALVRYYKIPLGNLLVAYDDVDIPFDTLRLRSEGGSGGHKGMQSIIQRLGGQGFPRVRIGIGRPPGRMEASDYVLQDFSSQELDMLPMILDRASDAALTYLTEGITEAMNQYNGCVDG